MAPSDRLPAIQQVWLPCLMGQQNPHLDEAMSLFSELVDYVDRSLAAAPIPEFRLRHQQQQQEDAGLRTPNGSVKRPAPSYRGQQKHAKIRHQQCRGRNQDSGSNNN